MAFPNYYFSMNPCFTNSAFDIYASGVNCSTRSKGESTNSLNAWDFELTPKIPRSPWRHHTVAWRGRTVWRRAETLGCLLFLLTAPTGENRLSSTLSTYSRFIHTRCNGWDSWPHKNQGPWRTRTSSNTSSSETRVSRRGELQSSN